MQAKERLYVWLRQATFNEEDGCRHPQDVLAIALGVTERTIIRATKELEAEGRIRVNRPRKRGQCNTYWVDCWNPSRRSGVLNILREIRPEVEQRRTQKQFKERARIARFARRYDTQCHPKRTAMPTRQLSRSLLLPLSLKAVKELVRSRVGASNRVLLTGRNDVLDQQELVCKLCEQVDRINGELKRALESINAAKTEQEFELAGARHTQRMLEKELHKLEKQQLMASAPAPEDSERTTAIKDVLRHWRTACGHPKANIDSSGDRWKLVERMMKRYDRETLLDAVSYVGLCPYLKFGKRVSVGDQTSRYSKLSHCVGSDERVEENASGFRGACGNAGKNLRWVEEVWRERSAEEQMWAGLLADGVTALSRGVEIGVPLLEFIRNRREAQLRAWDGIGDDEEAA